MKKAVGYVRISTKDQSNFSLEGQQKFISDYCDRHKIILLAVFKDEGRSAKNFDRPDWKQLEKFISVHHRTIDFLIVVKYDRFSRNAAEGLQKIELLERKYSIIIASVFEEIFIDYDSPFFFKQRADMLVTAEYELHVIRDRTKFGNHQARLSGRFITRAPWGYKNARDENNKPIIVIDEVRAEVIKLIFQRFLSGFGFKSIYDEARTKGFTLQGHSSIKNILSNFVYAGLIEVPAYRKEPSRTVKGLHRAIIDHHTWQRTQALLHKDDRVRTIDNPEVPLRGEITCHCGRKLTAGRTRNRFGSYYWYYRCNTHLNINLSAVKLHEQFAEMLQYLSIPERMASYLISSARMQMKVALQTRRSDTESAKQKIRQLRDYLSSVEQKFIQGTIGPDTFEKWENKYRSEIAALEYLLESDSEDIAATWQRFEKQLPRLTDIGSLYEKATLSDKKLLIRAVFDRGLSYSAGAYRTPHLHNIFRHKEVILKEKGLLEIEGEGMEMEVLEESTPSGPLIELSHILTVISNIA